MGEARAPAASGTRWYQQPGVGRVAHVAGLDEDLGLGGQVEAGQVIAEDHAVVPVVVALGHPGVLQQRRPHVAAEPDRGLDHVVVGAVGHGLQDGEAPAAGGPAVGVNVDGHVGVGPVEDPGPAVHARPDAVVVLAREDHPGAELAQVSPQVGGDVEVEPGLGVPAVGLGARGVTGLPLAAVPDLVVDVGGVVLVAAVVPGVDADRLARQRPARRLSWASGRGAGRRPGGRRVADGGPAGGSPRARTGW